MRQRLPLLSLSFVITILGMTSASGQAPAKVETAAVVEEGESTSGNESETDSTQRTTEEAGVVSFQRDIAPILLQRCIECHGPKDPKNDFRVDDADSFLSFIEAGDISASALWTDYLRTEDEDMLMPPKSHGGPLSASELALISVWVQEGAIWPSGAKVESNAVAAASIPKPAAPMSLIGRLWAFQGYLHPATVHFPVALLLVGGAFVVVSWRYPILGQNVALVCLFLGTLSSIAASMMGWAFAVRRGYGAWDRIDTDSEIFWHRWSAIIVTTVAIVTSGFALRWLRNRNHRTGQAWKVGLLALAMMVGAVGHQGGELTYGKTFYKEAFDVLFGTEAAKPVPVEDVAIASEPVTVDQ